MFTLDRSRRGDLSRQLSAGLRMAIETGYYQPGEILPPVRNLAEILEISKGIAEQAVAKLREEGLISPRPAVGSVVCIIAAIAVDTAQDLKTGRRLGATPWKQQVGEIAGAVVSSFAVGV